MNQANAESNSWEMRLEGPAEQPQADEMSQLPDLLPLANARILELGCGTGAKTRQIAQDMAPREIIAAEVDPRAHAHNLRQDPINNVRFATFGAEAIPEPDQSFDLVLMFKSLHHVPLSQMHNALSEIARVLKPGGFAYISEPVFAGDFNEVIRLFHDESTVRQAAFTAVTQAVGKGEFELVAQHFFLQPVTLSSFAQFKAGIIDATYAEHNLTATELASVEAKFESFRSPAGFDFAVPNRVDLLRRPALSAI